MPVDAAVTHVRCGTACEYAVVPRPDGTAAAPLNVPAGTAFAGNLSKLDAQGAAALEVLLRALESVWRFVLIGGGPRAAEDVHNSSWRLVNAAGDSITDH